MRVERSWAGILYVTRGMGSLIIQCGWWWWWRRQVGQSIYLDITTFAVFQKGVQTTDGFSPDPCREVFGAKFVGT
jgi:hypothetical protein